MSRLNLAPNFVSCTVHRARNLPTKGRSDGISPFCTIGMGKDKFATAVREKTSAPEWQEQCDMSIADDATIKLTVYHNTKNALSKGDFIGRAYVSLRDLQDYDRVHTSWYRLTNKEGKADKDRGEIEVSLQFYRKNDTTGSVLDLATKKKHLSLTDIKKSLSGKFKSASKQRKQDGYNGDNQLADQRNRLEGGAGSIYNVRDFLDDSASESTSFAGSQFSLNSMSNHGQSKKMPSSSTSSHALPPMATPQSSRRSVTSDYETSSILDSASMHGGEQPSNRTTKQEQRSNHVQDEIPVKKKSSPPAPAPMIITSNSRSSSITADDIDAAFDAAQQDSPSVSKSDLSFRLSTIEEQLDEPKTNKKKSSRRQSEDDLDFDNYFTQQKKEQSRASDIATPSVSLTVKTDSNSNSNNTTQDDDVDEDVEELLGKLERMSSIRSSVKRKIQPREDIMQQSFYEPDNKLPLGTPSMGSRNNNQTLPDIVGERSAKTPSASTVPTIVKPTSQGLSVLGYTDVKSTPIHPKIRQELDYLDREELLHVIAHQNALLKKRDTRLKDLEQYTDGLLVKIVEQCPTILQNGSSKPSYK